MPDTTTGQGIQPAIEQGNGGGSSIAPPGGGDRGSDGANGGRNGPPSATKYYIGIAIAIVAILMFFMALASAFLIRKGTGGWVPVRVPGLLWVNTAVLLGSSATLEMARKRLARSDASGFRKLWRVTTILGVLFLVGQVVAWRILAAQGIYLATNPASSFFYLFTGAHALHLLGGICALLYVAWRNFDQAKVSLAVAAEVASYYWHFMDALWLFLLALLVLGK
jgi:cytochrome c oxidase subunit 3